MRWLGYFFIFMGIKMATMGFSWSWNHASVPYCKYGESGNPPVGCFDLCTAFWHCICLACCTGRLVCKFFNIYVALRRSWPTDKEAQFR